MARSRRQIEKCIFSTLILLTLTLVGKTDTSSNYQINHYLDHLGYPHKLPLPYENLQFLIPNFCHCSGLTHANYKEMNVLYEKYKDKGLLAIHFIRLFSCYFIYYLHVLKENCWDISSAIFLYLIGLEILAFPCNQFLSQEPGSNEEIQEVACTMFKAEFPIFDKVIKGKWKLFFLFSLLNLRKEMDRGKKRKPIIKKHDLTFH